MSSTFCFVRASKQHHEQCYSVTTALCKTALVATNAFGLASAGTSRRRAFQTKTRKEETLQSPERSQRTLLGVCEIALGHMLLVADLYPSHALVCVK